MLSRLGDFIGFVPSGAKVVAKGVMIPMLFSGSFWQQAPGKDVSFFHREATAIHITRRFSASLEPGTK